MPTVSDYLSTVQSVETTRATNAQVLMGAGQGRRQDDSRFAGWLSLLALVCPGPITQGVAGTEIGQHRQSLIREFLEST